MQTIRTPEIAAKFLNALSDLGNVTLACQAAGIGRAAAYDWRSDDPVFAEQWAKAVALGVEGLEDEAVRRARESSDTLLIFLLKANKPEKYRETFRHVGANGGAIEVTDTTPIELARRLAFLLTAGVHAAPTIEGEASEP